MRNLLNHGADPYAKMKTIYEGQENSETVLGTLLNHHSQSAIELLNLGVKANEQNLDSDKLLVVLDYELFYQNGIIECNNIINKNRSSYYCASQTDEEHSKSLEEGEMAYCDEMSAHKTMMNLKLRNVLNHPLSESFLHLKWQLSKSFFYINILFYVFFLFFLTNLVLYESSLLSCDRPWFIHHPLFLFSNSSNYLPMNSSTSESANDQGCVCMQNQLRKTNELQHLRYEEP